MQVRNGVLVLSLVVGCTPELMLGRPLDGDAPPDRAQSVGPEITAISPTFEMDIAHDAPDYVSRPVLRCGTTSCLAVWKSVLGVRSLAMDLEGRSLGTVRTLSEEDVEEILLVVRNDDEFLVVTTSEEHGASLVTIDPLGVPAPPLRPIDRNLLGIHPRDEAGRVAAEYERDDRSGEEVIVLGNIERKQIGVLDVRSGSLTNSHFLGQDPGAVGVPGSTAATMGDRRTLWAWAEVKEGTTNVVLSYVYEHFDDEREMPYARRFPIGTLFTDRFVAPLAIDALGGIVSVVWAEQGTLTGETNVFLRRFDSSNLASIDSEPLLIAEGTANWWEDDYGYLRGRVSVQRTTSGTAITPCEVVDEGPNVASRCDVAARFIADDQSIHDIANIHGRAPEYGGDPVSTLARAGDHFLALQHYSGLWREPYVTRPVVLRADHEMVVPGTILGGQPNAQKNPRAACGQTLCAVVYDDDRISDAGMRLARFDARRGERHDNDSVRLPIEGSSIDIVAAFDGDDLLLAHRTAKALVRWRADHEAPDAPIPLPIEELLALEWMGTSLLAIVGPTRDAKVRWYDSAGRLSGAEMPIRSATGSLAIVPLEDRALILRSDGEGHALVVERDQVGSEQSIGVLGTNFSASRLGSAALVAWTEPSTEYIYEQSIRTRVIDSDGRDLTGAIELARERGMIENIVASADRYGGAVLYRWRPFDGDPYQLVLRRLDSTAVLIDERLKADGQSITPTSERGFFVAYPIYGRTRNTSGRDEEQSTERPSRVVGRFVTLTPEDKLE